MERQCERSCDTHTDPFDCADVVMHRYGSGWFGLIIHDGGPSSYAVRYCPWCGSRLADASDDDDAPDARRIEVD
jgi:hypothetical protein